VEFEMEVVLRGVSRRDLRGSILVTGFRGFGMVGYMASKHLALALGASKVGYILADTMPPFIAVEEDGIGYPFDVYYSREAGATILVNRAVPEREVADEYSRFLAEWAKNVGFRFTVLLGGLSREFKPPGDEHGYRWLHNTFYEGPQLEAPKLEYGLGVMGPLALLYIYLDYYEVPSIMILPYSIVEGVDYDAALLGIKVVASKLLKVTLQLPELETLARTQRAEFERIIRLLEREEREEHESRGIYM
jgi:uncharacterized protein